MRTHAPRILALTADETGDAALAPLDQLRSLIDAPAGLVADDAPTLSALLTEAVAELDDATVGELAAAITTLFDAVRDGTAEGVPARDVALLTQLVEARQSLDALAGQRYAEAEAEDETIAQLEAQLAATASDDTDDDDDDDGDGGDDDGGEAAPVDDTDAAAVPEPVLASVAAGSGHQRRRVAARARARAAAAPARDPRIRLTAGTGGVIGMDGDGIGQTMAEGWRNMGVAGGWRNLATISTDHPRILGDSARENGRIIDEALAANTPEAWTEARVAAGGWCADSDIEREVITQALADRPVRDSLPQFGAMHGGVQIPVSPTLSVIEVDGETNPDAAIRIWTETDDENAVDDDEVRKPVQRVDCDDSAEFRLYAITRRLRFGNFQARANPQRVAAWEDLLLAAYARKAESRLLTLMKSDAGTTELVQPDHLLGAARDVAELVLRLTTFMRSAERAGDERVHGWFPDWLIALMQADMIRAERDTVDLTVARAELVRIFGNAGITPTFYRDTPLTGPSQLLGKQTNNGAPAAWPCAIQFGLAFEGHYGFMEQPDLNLGVVRSPELNAANDFETFAEGFEGLFARRGPEALWVTQDVMANGTSSSSIDISDEDLCDDATSG